MTKSASKFQLTEQGEFTIIRLQDREITDQLYITELTDELTSVIHQKKLPIFLMDFNEVELFSSAALGMLVVLLKRVGSSKRFRLASVDPNIREVFEITHLDRIFPIYPDVSTAMAG